MKTATSTQGSPNQLIDNLICGMNCKNDAELSRRLEVTPPIISKIRSAKVPIGSMFLIRAHEESGFSIAQLKQFAGLPPAKPFDRDACNK